MSQVDSIEAFYQEYRELAEFFIIYIREAHAADSNWPVFYALEEGINQPKSYEDRCTVAETLVSEKKLTIPCLIDKMDNEVNEAYKGLPTRIFLIREDGRLGVAGTRGPFGLIPAFKELKVWMQNYRETQDEKLTYTELSMLSSSSSNLPI